MVTEEQMYVRCLTIEALVKELVLKGTTDNESLAEVIDTIYQPETKEEMEKYSEAIIYAKFSILN